MSKVLLLLVLVGLPRGLRAQAAAGVLVEMASHAGVIFAGEVASISRHDDAGYVDVGFHVDAAVLGCQAGGTYTVREWAGRWIGHGQRYLVGQRLLMLLTPPGPAGLSAPVYGIDGAIAIVAGAAGTVGDVGAGAGPVVDLRLLAARVNTGQASPRTDYVLAGTVAGDAAAVWPALADVLALLGGAGARP